MARITDQALALYRHEMIAARTADSAEAVDTPQKGTHRVPARSWLHTRNHAAVLKLALRQRDRREALGQVVRIIVAAPGSLAGALPRGQHRPRRSWTHDTNAYPNRPRGRPARTPGLTALHLIQSRSAGRHGRCVGAYMTTATPMRQMSTSVTSHRSGRKPSMIMLRPPRCCVIRSQTCWLTALTLTVRGDPGLEGIEDVDVCVRNGDPHHQTILRWAEIEAEERTAAALAFGEIACGGFALR
jgi:hypothetical protein